jgi:hypothetical protein
VGGLDFENLKGPLNDVKAMRALLTSAKFGFPDDPQHMHLLLDTDATRAAVLTALDTYVANPTPGSIVVVYVASHGSLRINDQGAGQVYMLDGEQHHLDGTIVPADPYLGKDDITSYELRTVFMNAAKRGVHVTAIFDSCHSGGQARGADTKLVKRSLRGPSSTSRQIGWRTTHWHPGRKTCPTIRCWFSRLRRRTSPRLRTIVGSRMAASRQR